MSRELFDAEPEWVREIHGFWFGEQDVREDEYEHLFRRWYRGGPRLDQEILERFGGRYHSQVEALEAGGLCESLSSPRARLVLVLLLDQLSRNMFRGSGQMFASDGLAQELVLGLLEDGGYEELAHIERLFLCVALEHAEDVERVRLSARLMRDLAQTAPAPQKQRFASMCRYNKQHLDIVEAFGRYPHRNGLLGRDTTAEEAQFLEQKNYRFMRSVQKGYR